MRYLDPLRWLIRVPLVHRIVHGLTADGPDCSIDRYVWRRLASEPGLLGPRPEGEYERELDRPNHVPGEYQQ